MDKSLAIISDARLGGRTDSQVVVERLLSISGEDALTIDRKNLEPITVKLPTRLVIFSNELPRLGDSSGALAGRMILLRLTRSFYGQEDTGLTDRLLGELPGILNWAIAGWQRLRERGRFRQPTAADEMVDELSDLAKPGFRVFAGLLQNRPGVRSPTRKPLRIICGVVQGTWPGTRGRRSRIRPRVAATLASAHPQHRIDRATRAILRRGRLEVKQVKHVS